jgi:hypothetical protein
MPRSTLPTRRAGPAETAFGPPLELVREAKAADLLADTAPDLHRLEASGLSLELSHEGGLLWVIFDNLPHIAALDPDLRAGSGHTRLVRRSGPAPGYEDIACDGPAGRRYVLIEATPVADGTFRPQIDEFYADWRLVARRWVELVVETPNKGLEGLSCVHRAGRRYLLALSEGNDNRGGRRGRLPGKGLVHVLEQVGDAWVVQDRIQLPADLAFRDYSGLSVRGVRIAVVSQEASALWVGRLDRARWTVVDDGQVFPFPRDGRGRIRYGTVEGVCWLDDDRVAVVSDRAKRTQPLRFRETGESIHVFALPPTARRPDGDARPRREPGPGANE